MFRNLQGLCRCVFARGPAAKPPTSPAPLHDGDAEPPQRGCGWFDSSHDLCTGLVVQEGMMVVDNTPVSLPA
jgi:hypothetical protein